MTAVIHHSEVQGYLVSKITFMVFFIVKGKTPWTSLDRKERRVNIRKFLHKKCDRDLGWPLPVPIWRHVCRKDVAMPKWQDAERGYERTCRKGPLAGMIFSFVLFLTPLSPNFQ